VLRRYQEESPEFGSILIAYFTHTQERLADLLPGAPPPIPIHGDFTPWNLRFRHGRVSAVLDLDASYLDLRVADFALTWRGAHEDVLLGYEEVSPLSQVERDLVLPVYWAWVIASAIGGIEAGEPTRAVEWATTHLLRTSLDARTPGALRG
jgi:Ser/Thr protein kinase RdoA (MazF antagonist)